MRATPSRPDPWGFLQQFTTARISLGRAGASLPTQAQLAFQWAHAQARDAVHCELDDAALSRQLAQHGWRSVELHSAAHDRAEFIARPDKGRILNAPSIERLEKAALLRDQRDVVFVVADGLSALAVQRHAINVLAALEPAVVAQGWSVAPLCVVRQGRVAIGDEIGALLGARLAVVLIGERPGLSSPDSLGLYLTYQPAPGRTNAQRNCISNVRPEGLPYTQAAHKLLYLMRESLRRQLSGVELKEDAGAMLDANEAPTSIRYDTADSTDSAPS